MGSVLCSDLDLWIVTKNVLQTHTFALVLCILSQGIPIESIFAPVTVETSRIIDALQTFARQAVAIPNSIGVNVVTALAEAAKPGGAILTKRISKIAIIAQFTPFAYKGKAH